MFLAGLIQGELENNFDLQSIIDRLNLIEKISDKSSNNQLSPKVIVEGLVIFNELRENNPA